jgi:hypothetical protein
MAFFGLWLLIKPSDFIWLINLGNKFNIWHYITEVRDADTKKDHLFFRFLGGFFIFISLLMSFV